MAAWTSAPFRNAPVTSTAPGKVIFAGRKSGYGRCVDVDHGYGFVTRYGHLASISVKKGQTVTLGQKLGGMGTTGRSTGVHLHYEVHFKNKTYDPKKVSEGRKTCLRRVNPPTTHSVRRANRRALPISMLQKDHRRPIAPDHL